MLVFTTYIECLHYTTLYQLIFPVYRFPKPLDPELKGTQMEEEKKKWSDTLDVECAWGKQWKEVGYEEREKDPDYKPLADIVPGCVDPRGCK